MTYSLNGQSTLLYPSRKLPTTSHKTEFIDLQPTTHTRHGVLWSVAEMFRRRFRLGCPRGFHSGKIATLRPRPTKHLESFGKLHPSCRGLQNDELHELNGTRLKFYRALTLSLELEAFMSHIFSSEKRMSVQCLMVPCIQQVG